MRNDSLSARAGVARRGRRAGLGLVVEADGSIFVEGGKDATLYTVTAETSLTGITGIRIEALADDRLPKRGPGRAPNGNFVLTELEMLAGAKPVKLHKPLADFSQAGFGPDQAINGKNVPPAPPRRPARRPLRSPGRRPDLRSALQQPVGRHAREPRRRRRGRRRPYPRRGHG